MVELSKMHPVEAVDAMPKAAGIAAALAAAQGAMDRARKGASNLHFKSRYADLSDVMDACMAALSANGIAVVQPVLRDGDRLFVETRLIHGPSGETLSDGGMPLLVSKNDMQGLGSAITYARRYGLMCMAGVAADDDDGNAASRPAPTARIGAAPAAAPPAPPATVTAEQFERLRDLADKAGVPEERLCATYGATSLEEFPAAAFEGAVRKLGKTIEAKAAPALDDEIPY